jgi:H+-translocating NAD(P) transhydrogenase subunit alpha
MPTRPGSRRKCGRSHRDGAGIDPFVFRFAIFVLAIFVGYYVVWSVTPALHTPLMSVTNAISSVIVVGALLAVGAGAMRQPGSTVALVLGAIALTLASVNIFGGFLVTQRMLGMYRKKGRGARMSANVIALLYLVAGACSSWRCGGCRIRKRRAAATSSAWPAWPSPS